MTGMSRNSHKVFLQTRKNTHYHCTLGICKRLIMKKWLQVKRARHEQDGDRCKWMFHLIILRLFCSLVHLTIHYTTLHCTVIMYNSQHSRFFVQDGHETTNAPIGKQQFFYYIFRIQRFSTISKGSMKFFILDSIDSQ